MAEALWSSAGLFMSTSSAAAASVPSTMNGCTSVCPGRNSKAR